MDALLADGMGVQAQAMILDGMGGTVSVPVRDSAQKEFFHSLNFAVRSSEVVSVEQEDLVAGSTVTLRKRGVGQFGVFRKATSDQTDWKVRVYADADKSMMLAEFEG